jgi:hypothetical protein
MNNKGFRVTDNTKVTAQNEKLFCEKIKGNNHGKKKN